jgi:hypothetical protein
MKGVVLAPDVGDVGEAFDLLDVRQFGQAPGEGFEAVQAVGREERGVVVGDHEELPVGEPFAEGGSENGRCRCRR